MITPDSADSLSNQARALLAGTQDPIANAANLSAFIFQNIPLLNWAGFYRLVDGRLLLGPFQGKFACVEIALDKGVCGKAARERKTQVVGDVLSFPGHIACDAASRSEIVVPLITQEGRLLGVLDIDSPVADRFQPTDVELMEEFAAIFLASISDKTESF
ncbi:MAG: GAF domain-containing protein [Opitutales bacterium]|nr:GAF domain-containing protein [Opitutales bacterium]